MCTNSLHNQIHLNLNVKKKVLKKYLCTYEFYDDANIYFLSFFRTLNSCWINTKFSWKLFIKLINSIIFFSSCLLTGMGTSVCFVQYCCTPISYCTGTKLGHRWGAQVSRQNVAIFCWDFQLFKGINSFDICFLPKEIT